MGIIAWIVLGAIAGYIAGFLVKGDEGLGVIGHIVLGIVGAVVGGFLAIVLLNTNPVDGAVRRQLDRRLGHRRDHRRAGRGRGHRPQLAPAAVDLAGRCKTSDTGSHGPAGGRVMDASIRSVHWPPGSPGVALTGGRKTMDDVKKVYRETEQNAKETWRKSDGDEDLADKVGNAGDEIRKDLGNTREKIDRRRHEEDRRSGARGAADALTRISTTNGPRTPSGGRSMPGTSAQALRRCNGDERLGGAPDAGARQKVGR